jgi:hypothetical protein
MTEADQGASKQGQSNQIFLTVMILMLIVIAGV